MLKILWSVNIVFPQVAEKAKKKAFYGGSWLKAMSARLCVNPEVKIAIAMPGNNKHIEKCEVNNIIYYIYPSNKRMLYHGGGKKSANQWEYIIDDYKPDIIHAYGTEYAYNLELIRTIKDIPIVISLQGIMSEYYRHYYGGLEIRDVLFNISIRDILRRSGMVLDRHRFKISAKNEKEMLSTAKYVEGRTLWDKTASLKINPDLKYYHCPRLIRKEFYCEIGWDISKIEPYSIFVHQATYPIKGLHFMLEALFLIRKKYPEVKLYISGKNIVDSTTIIHKLKATGYSNYIKKKIKTLKLENCINFTGPLDAQQLVDRLKTSHVMVIPSAIENSPNSLAEGMLVGTPCVASFVGGNPEMLKDKEEGLLYGFNEPGMLAEYISQIFESDELAQKFSKNARATAMKRHDPEILEKTLIDIYKDIIKK